MKAVAFAIIIASMNLIPNAEIKSLSEGTQNFAAFLYLICWIGFFFSLAAN
jgi:hypothetical protein